MKTYFAGSIRGGRKDKDIYAEIIKTLSEYGKVLTEHVGKKNLSEMGETKISDEEIYERDTKWIDEADIIIAEVTTPSIGVGYEIAYAEAKNKKIVCLFRDVDGGKRISAMISGNNNFQIREYKNLSELTPFFKNIF